MGGVRVAVCLGAAGAVLVFPLAAQAQTKTVNIGLPKGAQKKFQNTGADVNNFFPHGVTIHAGDKVKFKPVGEFHTVDLPRRGQSALPIITPDGKKVSGALDAAGAPFWFNGQDELSFNPVLGPGIYGKNVTFNGKKRIDSGAPLGNKLKPFTVKFPNAGTYTYFCDIHPGMKGVVRVVPKGRRIPSAQADKQTLDRQIKRDLKTAKSLAATKPPSGIVDVGVRGPGNVELYAMVPGSRTIPVGTTLRFRMSPGSTEFHTATFGPGDPERDPSSYLGQIAGTFQGNGPFDARALYPSEQPPTIASLTPLLHGNGFWSTGWMDRSGTRPTSGSVTFSAAGTYQYYCMIHPFMHGTITVQ
jgi:plastocyanin